MKTTEKAHHGQGPSNGLCRIGRPQWAADYLSARQSHIILFVAQYHAACAGFGRCIAIDLIGMGDSEKLPDSGPDRYTFVEHSAYFEAALEALGVTDNAVLVSHDWGSALGFHYASRHAARVAGICYMEAIVAPIPNWDEWPDNARDIFQTFRSPAGEEVVLDKNVFVEGVLPSSIMRKLDEAEMNHYRAPFTEAGEARRPTLTWPRQIPIAGEPADVVEIATNYAAFMAETDLPKLFINADPGQYWSARCATGAGSGKIRQR